MVSRHRIATGFLVLACLIVLICMTQRVASLRALQMPPAGAASLTVKIADSDNLQGVTPCELSAKTLLQAPPLLFDNALPALDFLLAVLALLCTLPLTFPPARECRAPLRRIHLINCNFRE